MNLALLFDRLRRFDAMIGQTTGWQALLLVDRSSSHGNPTNLPELKHTKLKFIPKNTTPLLQLFDLEMIACKKKRCKRMIERRAVNLKEAEHIDDPFKIDIRVAGMWVYDIWTRLQHDII